jgi:DNA-binding IclR family transcriptional regulator
MVRSVEKALRVLRSFDGTRRRLSLSEIAAATGLDFSSAQRFTYTLQQLGYLHKDEQSRLYGLTPRTLEFGVHYQLSSELAERARPYLLHLHTTFLETTNLTVLDDRDIVFVSRFLSRNIFNVDVVVGTRLPAFCTAPGLAILSRMDPDQAEAIVRRSDRRAFTAKTVTAVQDIVGRLAEVYIKGYAVVSEEMFLGDISVAAPVLDSSGRPVAAINVASSTSHWTVAEAEAKFATTVVATANAASGERRVLPKRAS